MSHSDLQQEQASKGDPIIIQGPTIVELGPLNIPPAVIIVGITVTLCDIIVLAGDPLPIGEFRMQNMPQGAKAGRFYSEHNGVGHFSIPDHYFSYSTNIPSNPANGCYDALVQFTDRGDFGDYWITSDKIAKIIIASTEEEAAAIYAGVMAARSTPTLEQVMINRKKALFSSVTSDTMRGILGFSAIFTELLVSSVQQKFNEGNLKTPEKRTQYQLPNGELNRSDIFEWARRIDGNRTILDMTVGLILTTAVEISNRVDAHTASVVEKIFLERIQEQIKKNRITAALDGIDAYNSWYRDDQAKRRQRLPTLMTLVDLGTSPPDTFLKTARAGIPPKMTDSRAFVGSLVGAIGGLSGVATAAGLGVNVIALVPYSAPLGSVFTSSATLRAALITGGVAVAALLVTEAILCGAIDKLIYDGTYGKKLWHLYEDAQKPVRLVNLMKTDVGIRQALGNIILMMESPSPGLRAGNGVPLLRRVTKPVGA